MIHSDGKPTIAMRESDTETPVPPNIDRSIWEDIEEVWQEFRDSENVKAEDWMEAEDIQGLLEIKYGQAAQNIMDLSRSNPDPRVTCLTSYITGIRTGVALAKKRNGL